MQFPDGEFRFPVKSRLPQATADPGLTLRVQGLRSRHGLHLRQAPIIDRKLKNRREGLFTRCRGAFGVSGAPGARKAQRRCSTHGYTGKWHLPEKALHLRVGHSLGVLGVLKLLQIFSQVQRNCENSKAANPLPPSDFFFPIMSRLQTPSTAALIPVSTRTPYVGRR